MIQWFLGRPVTSLAPSAPFPTLHTYTHGFLQPEESQERFLAYLGPKHRMPPFNRPIFKQTPQLDDFGQGEAAGHMSVKDIFGVFAARLEGLAVGGGEVLELEVGEEGVFLYFLIPLLGVDFRLCGFVRSFVRLGYVGSICGGDFVFV